MVEVVRELAQRKQELDSRIRSLAGARVASQKIRDSARDLVDFYFRSVRAGLLAADVTESELQEIDSEMHALLESTHGRGSKSVYRRILREIGAQCVVFEKALLQRGVAKNFMERTADGVDLTIIETLQALVPTAARSYEQAILDLLQVKRLSWRGPATDLREAMRETLDHLAPDREVMGQQGFRLERDTAGPTMKQKVRYVLRKRGVSRSGIDAPESAVEAVDEAVGSFVRSVYTRSSISTHTPTDKREVLRVRDFVRVALCELLEIQS